jgi:hypothetical protein
MKKQLWIITFILLLTVMLVSAEINILLQSPADNTKTTLYTQDFIFSFNQSPSFLNCSVIVDNQAKGFRNTMIEQNNNKISLDLEAGTHAWFIKCIAPDFSETVSATRTLTISLGGEIKEGYETIYNNNGLRSYLLTIASGQKPVELPAMKAGEDIRIMLAGKTYYLDIIKMGADINTSFVEVKDRASGKTHRMLVLSSVDFDFNNDKTIELRLYLKEVERKVNAYFTVTPYPAAQAPPTPPAEPEQPAETPKEEPVEQPVEPVVTPPAEEPKEEPVLPNEEPIPSAENQPKSKAWLPALIILLVILVLIILSLIIIRRKKKKAELVPKKTPEKIVKKEAKHEKTEAKPATPPESIIQSNASDESPVVNEKFEIIKSSGRKMKK